MEFDALCANIHFTGSEDSHLGGDNSHKFPFEENNVGRRDAAPMRGDYGGTVAKVRPVPTGRNARERLLQQGGNNVHIQQSSTTKKGGRQPKKQTVQRKTTKVLPKQKGVGSLTTKQGPKTSTKQTTAALAKGAKPKPKATTKAKASPKPRTTKPKTTAQMAKLKSLSRKGSVSRKSSGSSQAANKVKKGTKVLASESNGVRKGAKSVPKSKTLAPKQKSAGRLANPSAARQVKTQTKARATAQVKAQMKAGSENSFDFESVCARSATSVQPRIADEYVRRHIINSQPLSRAQQQHRQVLLKRQQQLILQQRRALKEEQQRRGEMAHRAQVRRQQVGGRATVAPQVQGRNLDDRKRKRSYQQESLSEFLSAELPGELKQEQLAYLSR